MKALRNRFNTGDTRTVTYFLAPGRTSPILKMFRTNGLFSPLALKSLPTIERLWGKIYRWHEGNHSTREMGYYLSSCLLAYQTNNTFRRILAASLATSGYR